MIRVSDGKWTTRKLMRVNVVNGSTSELIGQTITGQTSGATAIVVSSVSFREAQTNIVELEIRRYIFWNFSRGNCDWCVCSYRPRCYF